MGFDANETIMELWRSINKIYLFCKNFFKKDLRK